MADPLPTLPAGMVGSRPLDRDKLSMVPRLDAARVAHLSLFPMQQQETPEELTLGVSVLFAAVSMRTGISPSDLFEMGRKVILAPEDGDRPTDNSLQCLRDFVGAKVMAQNITVG